MRVFGKRLFVSRSSAAGIRRGTEIVSINGIAAADVITKLSRYAAVDGFTDFARAALLEHDSDLMGSDLDQYWPAEFGFAGAWTLVLRDGCGVGPFGLIPRWRRRLTRGATAVRSLRRASRCS